MTMLFPCTARAARVHRIARAHDLAFGLLCLGLLSLSSPARAQPGPPASFSFLRLEPSARAAALGGSFAAVYGDDVNALFYNPALLNAEMDRMLSISYLNHLSDLNAAFLAYSRHVERLGTLAAGLRFLGWGELQGADEQGQLTDTFGASDLALTVGLARPHSDALRFGANVHLIYTGVESAQASALATDVGAVYRLPAQELTFSLSVNNLGVTLSSLGPTRDELPVDVRLGVAKRLEYVPLLLSITGYNLHDPGNAPEGSEALDRVLHHLALGGEFQFSDSFNVRFGYNHRRHEALKMKSRLDMAGFGLGFGLKLTRFRFDYAYNSWSSAGGLHQFTLRTVL